MKIINNTPCTLFRDVKVGDVFQCADEIFMRTDDNNTNWGLMNAVNLDSGLAVNFCGDAKVHLLPEAYVVIE